MPPPALGTEAVKAGGEPEDFDSNQLENFGIIFIARGITCFKSMLAVDQQKK